MVVARDDQGRVALLSDWTARHEGEHLCLPGGRREDGESPESVRPGTVVPSTNRRPRGTC
ncbi:hypothetical protein [Streptomyces sp. NPDC001389]|uniref:hypothetical protein n=1 Tax=Streptomyces sp. NPDC001389 TaxID=3364569 RepID=UPI00369AB77A